MWAAIIIKGKLRCMTGYMTGIWGSFLKVKTFYATTTVAVLATVVGDLRKGRGCYVHASDLWRGRDTKATRAVVRVNVDMLSTVSNLYDKLWTARRQAADGCNRKGLFTYEDWHPGTSDHCNFVPFCPCHTPSSHSPLPSAPPTGPTSLSLAHFHSRGVVSPLPNQT